MIEFTVEGQPQRKQRPKFRRRGNFVQTYTPKETVDYEKKIVEAYKEQIGDYMAFSGEEPLRVHIEAYFEIPKSLSKRKRQMAIENLILPHNSIDVDNTAKVVLDALNKVAYKDDHYITNLIIYKKYSEQPRLEIRISEVKL